MKLRTPSIARLFRGSIALAAGMAALWIVAYPLAGAMEPFFADYAGDLDRPLSGRAMKAFRFIEADLQKPFNGYSSIQTLGPEFAVVTLSHMACGLANVALDDPSMRERISPLLDETARRAMSSFVSPVGPVAENSASFDDHNLYWSHLNLILGCRRMIGGDGRYDALQARMSQHLADCSLADGDFHARSYPDSPKFPADQCVTLASLALQDRNNRTHRWDGLIQGWANEMKTRLVAPDSDLPRSSLDDAYPNASLPRGCALSWSALYMAQFAPEAGEELYAAYRREFFETALGFGGFREWPRGSNHGIDFDSGPVVLGLGMAATGLGLGAARIYHDPSAYSLILRTSTVGIPSVIGSRRDYLLAPLLGEAILFHGLTARVWFGKIDPRPYPPMQAFPLGSCILALLWTIPAAGFAWFATRQALAVKSMRQPIAFNSISCLKAPAASAAGSGASPHAGL